MKIKNDLENKEVAKAIRNLINKGYYSSLEFEDQVELTDCKTEDEVLNDLEALTYEDIPENHIFWNTKSDRDFEDFDNLSVDEAFYFLENYFRAYDTYSQILEDFEYLIQKELERLNRLRAELDTKFKELSYYDMVWMAIINFKNKYSPEIYTYAKFLTKIEDFFRENKISPFAGCLNVNGFDSCYFDSILDGFCEKVEKYLVLNHDYINGVLDNKFLNETINEFLTDSFKEVKAKTERGSN